MEIFHLWNNSSNVSIHLVLFLPWFYLSPEFIWWTFSSCYSKRSRHVLYQSYLMPSVSLWISFHKTCCCCCFCCAMWIIITLNHWTLAACVFPILFSRTCTISHMTAYVWCLPRCRTSKSSTLSVTSIKKDWSVWGSSMRSSPTLTRSEWCHVSCLAAYVMVLLFFSYHSLNGYNESLYMNSVSLPTSEELLRVSPKLSFEYDLMKWGSHYCTLISVQLLISVSYKQSPGLTDFMFRI